MAPTNSKPATSQKATNFLPAGEFQDDDLGDDY